MVQLEFRHGAVGEHVSGLLTYPCSYGQQLPHLLMIVKIAVHLIVCHQSRVTHIVGVVIGPQPQ